MSERDVFLRCDRRWGVFRDGEFGLVMVYEFEFSYGKRG
jgi:hypothetical protein